MTAPAVSRGGLISVAHEPDYLHCEQCGAETTRTPRIRGYNPTYGFPLYEYRRTCPKSRWWNAHTDQWTFALPIAPPDADDE